MNDVGDFFVAWGKALNAKDGGGIASICTEDVVWEDSALVSGESLHGRAAVSVFLEQYLFRPIPDLRYDLLELLWSDDGTKAVERARLSGTLRGPVKPLGLAPTGRPIAFEVAGFFEFREGNARRVRIILDMLDIARQTGAAPLPGTFSDRLVSGLQHLKAWRLRRR